MRVLDAYGLDDRSGLFATVERRQRVLYDTLEAWAAAGDPASGAMWRGGHGDGLLRDLSYLRQHQFVLERALLS